MNSHSGRIYNEGRSYIEDLFELTSLQNQRLLEQIAKKFDDLWAFESQKNSILKDHKYLNQFLRDSFVESFRSDLLKTSDVKSVHFSGSMLSFYGYDKLIKLSHLIIQTIKDFQFRGEIHLDSKGNTLEVKGIVNPDQWDPEIKLKSYKVSRLFIQERTWLTYKVGDRCKNRKLFNFELHLDFSDTRDDVLVFDFAHQQKQIGFSSSLVNHFSSLQEINNLDEHDILLIDYNLELKKFKKLPEDFLEYQNDQAKDYTFIHFSFLFRPISIIIPIKGEAKTAHQFFSGSQVKQSESFFDLFSFFNR